MTEDIELIKTILHSGNELGITYNKYSRTYSVDEDVASSYTSFSSALLKRIAILIRSNK